MKKDKIQALEIQSLNDDVLANLSIEELEERLEMQILHMTEAQLCWDCGTDCHPQCTTNTCTPNCGANCQTDSGCSVDYCSSESVDQQP
jgi:hypothetical protein